MGEALLNLPGSWGSDAHQRSTAINELDKQLSKVRLALSDTKSDLKDEGFVAGKGKGRQATG